MITVKSQPNGTYFSSAIPNLSIAITGDYAHITLTSNSDTVLSETYYADNTGTITLRDLSSLLASYAMQSGSISVNIKIDEYATTDGVTAIANTTSIDCTVIYANADVQISATSFLTSHFLTILTGDKITAVDRKEYLYTYGDSEGSVTARYYGKEGVTEEVISVKGTGSNNIYVFDVSPSQFERSSKTLIGYDVTVGTRSQSFKIDQVPHDCAPVLLFTNSFGCQELLYCTGTHQVAPEYNRSATYRDGQYVNFKIDEIARFKANTGILNVPMANWADDLFRSHEIYLFVDNQPDKRITITESKSERSNDDDAMPSFTFSYRYAQRMQNVLQLSHPGRIFDNTFDRTFN